MTEQLKDEVISKLLSTLADIALSEDMDEATRRKKALRVYKEESVRINPDLAEEMGDGEA